MSVGEIHRRLFWDVQSSSAVVIPNFTPPGWYECDFFRVTRAGYFYEYEIKMSLADFRADRAKHSYDWETKTYTSKHMQIAQAQDASPSRFYFVVPYDLEDKVSIELPEWAGLVVFERHLRIAKQAPILHRKKVSGVIVRHAKHSAYSRYWDLFLSHPYIEKIQRIEKEQSS